VGAELALTLMMLVGAGLMMRSFSLLMGLDRGMDAERVATLEISFPTRNNGEVVKSYMRMQKMDAIVDRVLAMPGIAAAGMVNDLPLGGSPGMAISVKVPDAPQEGEMKFARYLMASAGYFPTMGIRLLRGRNFTAADDSLAPRVAIISASMEKTYWQGVSALGRGFVMAEGQPLVTVVGIVADVREGRLERDPGPQMYFPIQQQTPATVALVARGTLPPAALLARLRDAVRAVDPSQAVYNVRMMDEVVSTSVAPRRANTLLISAFAVLALVLAALGVYAVVSYGVAQRAREFGIRSALGATGRDLVRHVAVEMVPVTVIGVGIGLAGAWALARVLTSLVYGVDVHDAATFVVVPLALVVPVVLATLVPARRAMRVNPAEVIRVD
jgi:predicted permease